MSLVDGAFAGCSYLTGISVGEGNAAFASVGGVLFSKDLSKLVYAPASIGGSATIPVGTASIVAGAFADCEGLLSIVVLGSVESIADGAFAAETASSALVALAESEDYDERKAVWEAAGFLRFSEPARPGDVAEPEAGKSGFAFELLDDLTLAVSWKGDADPAAELAVPSSAEVEGASYRVSAIALDGFAGRGSIESVSIPATVSVVGDGAFDGCLNLSRVDLPDGLVYVGGRAFARTALRSVTLPASVRTVGGGGVLSMRRA